MIVGESRTGGGASILARSNGCSFNGVFRIIRTVEIFARDDLTLTHIAWLVRRILVFVVSKWRLALSTKSVLGWRRSARWICDCGSRERLKNWFSIASSPLYFTPSILFHAGMCMLR